MENPVNPSDLEVAVSVFKTELDTILDPRASQEFSRRAALEWRRKIMSDPKAHAKLYRGMFPTFADCMRMWWLSFMRRLLRDSEFGRKVQ